MLKLDYPDVFALVNTIPVLISCQLSVARSRPFYCFALECYAPRMEDEVPPIHKDVVTGQCISGSLSRNRSSTLAPAKSTGPEDVGCINAFGNRQAVIHYNPLAEEI